VKDHAARRGSVATHLPTAASFVTVAIGLLVAAGWVGDIAALKGPLMAVLVVSTNAMLAVVVWHNARSLVALEAAHDRAQQALQDLAASAREQEEASRLKSEFLANMSHELRTPLNAIIGFANLLHKGTAGPISAEQREYLGDVLTSSRHLLQVINDVLDLAKVESGTMDIRPERVDLAGLIGEVQVVLRGLASSKRLNIRQTVEPEVATAIVDPARVKQILYNYLSNAIKFTRDGGEIHVHARPEGPDLFRLDVADTGVGIAEADLRRLFVGFQQLDDAAGKAYQGTGLGLALTKRLAEAQGGRVSVLSAPGRGSTFSAILPRTLVAPPAIDPATPPRS
jgi:signal transduction histidine kinase